MTWLLPHDMVRVLTPAVCSLCDCVLPVWHGLLPPLLCSLPDSQEPAVHDALQPRLPNANTEPPASWRQHGVTDGR